MIKWFSNIPYFCSTVTIDHFLGFIYFIRGVRKPKLIFEEYDFSRHRINEGQMRWRCNGYYKLNCRAALRTSGNTVRVLNHHNHTPTYPNYLKENILVQRQVNVIK